MSLHTELPIFKVAYDLLDLSTELARNMPRDHKVLLGAPIRDECVKLSVLIYRANTAQDKRAHLSELIERVQVAELLIRLCRDKRLISVKQYAAAVALTQSVGRQANAWRKHSAASPAA
jgi:hypothetical protein